MSDQCRDCGITLTAANVWEPGTCQECAKRLTVADLHGATCVVCGAQTFGGQPICGRKACGEAARRDGS